MPKNLRAPISEAPTEYKKPENESLIFNINTERFRGKNNRGIFKYLKHKCIRNIEQI